MDTGETNTKRKSLLKWIAELKSHQTHEWSTQYIKIISLWIDPFAYITLISETAHVIFCAQSYAGSDGQLLCTQCTVLFASYIPWGNGFF